MRRSFLRALLVCLVSVLVPAQGMASVMAGQCMAFGHHDGGGAATHAHDVDAGEHSEHAHDDEGKTSHCGPCTACCASASIAGAPRLLELPLSSHAKVLAPKLPSSGARPDELFRPPLSL